MPRDITMKLELNRRTALKVSFVSGAGLTFALSLGSARGEESGLITDHEAFVPNAFLQISPSGRILIYNKCPEIGQGIKTAFPMIVAEELDAAWEDVHVEQAVINTEVYGHQRAAASYGILSSWDQLRRAGAVARSMLVNAAAGEWAVDASECSTQDSEVFHTSSGRSLRYGDLAVRAAQLPVPDEMSVTLKSEEDYRLIGQWVGGIENQQIVSGQPLYVSDIEIPDAVYATYERCPAFGGRVVSANLGQIRDLEGVIDAFIVEGTGQPAEIMPGIAIVATSTWSAIKAKKALNVVWDESDASKDSWVETVNRSKTLENSTGEDLILQKGDFDTSTSRAAFTLEARYSYPFITHAPMEPQSCLAWHRGDSVQIWSSTQTPDTAVDAVARIFSLSPDQVKLNQVRAGGAFGRRLYNNVVCEAVAISKRIGAPVKLQWTREDDTRNGFYRPGGFHDITGAVDENGKLIALRDHFITFSHTGDETVRVGDMSPDEFPASLIENVEFTRTMLPWKIPTGALRAPKSNAFAFVFQSFIHELADAAGRDHVEFLLELLGESRWLESGNVFALHTGRAANVIRVAAERAGWRKPLPEGRALGLGFYFSHASYFAEVAEVSVSDSNSVKVHKVTVVGDAGTIVNTSGAKSQCEGSVIDGISAMFGQQITFADGRVQEGNFDHYPLIRMADAPDVDVHFLKSGMPPSGLGEPALPPVIPAVCNAIFAASGRRVRALPLRREGFEV